MGFFRKDLLDLDSLSADEISLLLNTAERMKEISERPVKKVPTLRGKTVVLFFYEPSTRTRLSFDIAAKRLSADTIAIAKSGSSMVKGETLIDTAKNLEAMKPDIIVMRHSSAGAPHLIADRLECSVVNAGDGAHAHPTQALLDMLSIREKRGSIRGQRIAIVGDLSHSRVARSNMVGLTKMGAEVVVAAPPTMMPMGMEAYPGVTVTGSVDEAVTGADVIMMLRIQKERQENILFPTEREYARLFGLNKERVRRAKEDVLIMHPGPMNRGVEISPSVADGDHSIILDQVTNGVALRMAVFFLLTGGVRNVNVD